ncbi:MAG: hypothetical protein QOK37_955 [Thermoanaerobaculia bacterium]|nr:hypothetical protein [Thermoanaerobaculia bacterium]
MRILLDECVPRGLKRLLPGFDLVTTVPEVGLAGLKNGQLLRRIVSDFDTLITTDKNIQYQQNLAAYAVAFVLFRAVSNDIIDLAPLVPQFRARLDELKPGKLLIIE